MTQRLAVDKDPAFRIVGLGSSRAKDLGVHHDEAMIEELEREFREDRVNRSGACEYKRRV